MNTYMYLLLIHHSNLHTFVWSPLTEKFLYCEGCWADFYKEKFDGTRLSSINFRMSDL